MTTEIAVLAIMLGMLYLLVAFFMFHEADRAYKRKYRTNITARNEGEYGFVRAGKIIVYFLFAPFILLGLWLFAGDDSVVRWLFSKGGVQ